MTGQRTSRVAGRKPGRTGSPGRYGDPGRGVGSGQTRRRCAVYTRKSSEEGLEQEYNSLHVQREACEAYIRSQQHEGWTLVPTPFDDGGISGGTMDRPALQALLAEVRAGRIDIIVVYKVDRLTRSLADFAKMVELFDATGASFVAVTQQFNTTTSMGRLTLNVLLSFAQFEREVTGERIRDKIAASKRRGMWMGGRTPLGYDVQDRKLVVVPEDAAKVVHLYRRYLNLGCVRELKAELDGQAIVSKARRYASGTEAGGTPYSRGALYALLSNPVYIGQVRHKGVCYLGMHDAIVPEALYAAVQERLASGNGGGKGRSLHGVAQSLLAGKLFDEAGGRLTPSHARKGERRYRYYVSAKLVADGAGEGARSTASRQDGEADVNEARAHLARMRSGRSGWRLPAPEVEQSVLAAVLAILKDEVALATDLLEAGLPAADVPALLATARRLSAQASDLLQGRTEGQNALAVIVERVELSSERMLLALCLPGPKGILADPDHDGTLMIRRSAPHRLQRRGVELRLVLGGGAEQSRNDAALLKLVARAHCWFEDIVSGRVASAHELARQLNVSSRYVQRLLPLALLAPSVVERIVSGHQDPTLTADAASTLGQLPLRWSEHVDLLPR